MRHSSLPVLQPSAVPAVGFSPPLLSRQPPESAPPAPPSHQATAPPAGATPPGDRGTAAAAGPAAVPGFSAAELAALAAVARAVMPASAHGRGLPAAGLGTAVRVAGWLAELPPWMGSGYRRLLQGLAALAWLRLHRPLTELTDEQLQRLCAELHEKDFALRSLLRLLVTPLKLAYFDDPEVYRRFGAQYRSTPPGEPGAPVARPAAPADLPRPARERTQHASEVPAGEVLECDTVVIGSGAGGAVAAYELAAAGHAVILLEEGEFFSRSDFGGNAFQQQKLLYRQGGQTVALGNSLILIPVGRAVGGTTVINSGTCYRMPARVYGQWQDKHGLRDFTPESLAEHYERVEQTLGVSPAASHLLGRGANAVARGCEALGYQHAPLRRNAPDCDGQGVCCFGCPTDAKRSTNVSFVPMALQAGASLLTGARAERLVIEGGRAVGVRVNTKGSAGPGFTVRARAVIVACGALMTPVFLLGDPAARRALGRSRTLGENLTIHPAAHVVAMHREPVRSFTSIPQGYAIEEFHREGLLMEGVFLPLDLMAASLTLIGPEYMRAMAAYDRLSSFGFVIEDTGSGSVRPGPGGRPLIRYDVHDNDLARLRRGIDIISRVYQAAGIETIYTGVHGHEVVRGPEDLSRLRRARLTARDFELSAYHPLGTARMGADRSRSLVGPDLQAHDLPGLYVCDGSVLPTSPAVNPQLTIMAVARRAARALADKLA